MNHLFWQMCFVQIVLGDDCTPHPSPYNWFYNNNNNNNNNNSNNNNNNKIITIRMTFIEN